jgi:hypothetical protein
MNMYPIEHRIGVGRSADSISGPELHRFATSGVTF